MARELTALLGAPDYATRGAALARTIAAEDAAATASDALLALLNSPE
jgi:hypothetical protein